MVNYKTNKKAADEVVGLIGESAIAVGADVTNEKDAKRLVGETIHKFGHVDMLINNVGEIFRPGD